MFLGVTGGVLDLRVVLEGSEARRGDEPDRRVLAVEVESM
jgi:hypothetical protein